MTRATLIDARSVGGVPERLVEDRDLEADVTRALGVLNDVIRVHRIAADDPALVPLTRSRVTVTRVGIGAGDLVADGRWDHAVTLPPAPTARGRTALEPTQRLAAVLGGRDVVLACEVLVLRAREDADAGRWREAAFQLRVGLEAALAEFAPWAGQGDIDARISELRSLREATGALANGALERGLDDAQIGQARNVLERLESALRSRAALACA
ncbi:unannotated protein [freshwater metagenome]|uniref:Unannotated protein n=1 Tax=freshwater metagenome TaxID=449393 RepID=A0A6J7J008_9ZZZZ|nr:hypothetical protein [Actinomycetota bacterium]